MSQCERIHEMMAGALYDDLDEDQRGLFNAHVQSCPECARLYRQMAETLRIMNARTTTERDEAFWAGYWERLAAHLETDQRQRQTALRKRLYPERRVWFPYPVLRAGAIAALVLVGIFLGRWIWTEERPSSSGPDAAISIPGQANAASALLEDRTQSYLQKSKVLLLALANFDPYTEDAATLNLQRQKRISESLVQEAAYLKTALADPAETRLKELVGDLEVILLQIANLEDEYDLEAVEMIQRGANKQGVLFRIDLSEISRRNPEISPGVRSKSKTQRQI